ncbi:type III PLP-dependent enzyme [Kitasatospora paracochleata]|uniref:Diaminopimelate decarboxylase n=1 Tax=Kitasatospora paracochleata TaxID=58354 RepID=A0ABT1JA95_9ACTN|nr:diaminopimelate decarboxylase [Kitasatospora paracochleata]MCP2314365.1 diaminopimelate decarboxylase [Kitasatospora paracochleata]
MTQEVDWDGIAARFGTPTYVYDGDWLAANLTALRAALHPALEVFFSLKSNPNRGVYDVLHAAGARAEVSSLAELRVVLEAGTDPADVVFLGPGKSGPEIEACVGAGIYAIVCESFAELAAIDLAAADRGVRQRVLLRVNPAFSVTGSRLTMGGKPRQFGIDEAELLAGTHPLTAYEHADVAGIQVYLGTRILDADVVVRNTAYILDLADRIAAATGIRLDAVDIGGGLGVPYFEGEHELDTAALAKDLNPLLDAFAAAHPGTRLIMESGRYLTALGGTYLMRVRYTKRSMGEDFAVADGGTHHHMAAVGIGSFVKRNFPVALLSRTPEPDEESGPWNIAGPLCTPNDTIAKAAVLPALRPGDLIGVERSGAYGPSASPVYFLSHGYPAEVVLRHGRAHLVRARDTVEDILGRQSTHPDLSRPTGRD